MEENWRAPSGSFGAGRKAAFLAATASAVGYSGPATGTVDATDNEETVVDVGSAAGGAGATNSVMKRCSVSEKKKKKNQTTKGSPGIQTKRM